MSQQQASRPSSRFSNMSSVDRTKQVNSETPVEDMKLNRIDEAAGTKNPFTMPTDEEVFTLREEERRKKNEARGMSRKLKVWEKETASSRMNKTMLAHDLTKDLGKTAQDVSNVDQTHTNILARATAALSKEQRKEKKENMADFIAKKREMFLVQMALDTKRAEIRKLEERAALREQALRESEQMLEEDAMRFDAFLKDNDMKAVDAIKAAENETKLKNDKVQEIKKLNSHLAAIRSEMSKYEEQLDECKEYKLFLDQLTPTDWFEEQQKKIEKRKQDRAEKLAANPDAKFEDDLLDEDDFPMYFTHPQQLLDIFTELEESNLFLIQNSQETEEALEELKQKFDETKARMDAQCENLQTQIQNLEDQIRVEENKMKVSNNRIRKNADAEMEEKLLQGLNGKVAEVYEKCGFDSDAGLSTLQMLANIEARLEDYLRQIDQMPRELVEQAEKMKEKDRRRTMRDAKLQEQQLFQLERSKRAEARSRAPIQKKVGKQVMFRSPPLQKKRKEISEGQNKEQDDEEDREFFM